MSVIESRDYEDARQRLMRDPVVQQMAADLDVPRHLLAHEDGTPRSSFMNAANEVYRERGGTGGAHIGAVAEAILRLKDEGEV